jgi:hypothetical protein
MRMPKAACISVLVFASACTSSSAVKPATVTTTTVAATVPTTTVAASSIAAATTATTTAGPTSRAARYGTLDPLFGSLTPRPDGTCSLGAPALQGDQTRCAKPNGEFINPYLDRFVSLWNPAAVKSVEVNTESNHFPQEQSPGRVADIVDGM